MESCRWDKSPEKIEDVEIWDFSGNWRFSWKAPPNFWSKSLLQDPKSASWVHVFFWGPLEREDFSFWNHMCLSWRSENTMKTRILHWNLKLKIFEQSPDLHVRFSEHPRHWRFQNLPHLLHHHLDECWRRTSWGSRTSSPGPRNLQLLLGMIKRVNERSTWLVWC